VLLFGGEEEQPDCKKTRWNRLQRFCLGKRSNLVLVVVLVVQQFGVGPLIERSLVRPPAGALSSQLGQFSLLFLWGR